MDLSETDSSILRFTRQVMWRRRINALQRYIAVAILAGGLVAAALVLYTRLRAVAVSALAVAIAVMAVALAAAFFLWIKKRASERDSAFLIDGRLALEDRFITSQGVLARGGPRNDFEVALLDDAAGRINDRDASEIAPYRLSPWSALGLVGVAALVISLAIPESSLPGGEELAAARADIQSAGEVLEQSAAEIESGVAPESETAGLAKEQAELGRSLRVSPETREEALKKLSALEQRIRRRHDELASTRADEIVSLAEQRLRAAISPRPATRRGEAGVTEGDELRSERSAPGDATTAADKDKSGRNARRENRATAANNSQPAQPPASKTDGAAANRRAEGSQAEGSRARSETAQSRPQAAQTGNVNPQNRPQEPVPGESQPAAGSTPTGQPQTGQQANGAQGGAQPPAQSAPERQQPTENQPSPDSQQQPGGLTGVMAEQAAKATASMSEDLLKKAQELRAGQMSAEDIRRMAQMAEFLARDLSKIAESKELQAAVEQLARQVSPEQLEQVARELMRNEQLRRELEATARMLAQNQQVRELVSGLARQFGQRGGQGREKRGQNQGGEVSQTDEGGGQGRGEKGQGTAAQSGQSPDENRLKGQGREVKAGGNLQRKDGGEYLYLQSKAEAGAARAPYSSAYPQYRREAERSIQRSQVPPHMRSVVRRYFDAINPDARKRP